MARNANIHYWIQSGNHISFNHIDSDCIVYLAQPSHCVH